jgi:hypothetical protein
MRVGSGFGAGDPPARTVGRRDAAQLLGVLRLAGDRHGVFPPHGVIAGMQGLRLWALAVKDLQAAGTGAEKPIPAE